MSGDAEYFKSIMEKRLIERGINPNDVCPSEYLNYFFEDEHQFYQVDHYNKNNELPAGKCIHIVTLTTDSPAMPLSVEWLHYLEKPLYCYPYNHLTNPTWREPAQFFIERGMQVRSRKIDSQWKQIIFCNHQDYNLSDSDMNEYESRYNLKQSKKNNGVEPCNAIQTIESTAQYGSHGGNSK